MTMTAINEVNKTTFVKVSHGSTFTKIPPEGFLACYELHRIAWPMENRPPLDKSLFSDELEAWEAASDEALENFDKEFPPLES